MWGLGTCKVWAQYRGVEPSSLGGGPLCRVPSPEPGQPEHLLALRCLLCQGHLGVHV